MSTRRRREKRARIESDDEFESQRPSSSSSSTQRRVKVQPGEGGGGEGDTDWNDEQIERKVKDVVRYALASEFKRKPMRRDEIVKIIGSNNRNKTFIQIMGLVRDKLKHVFGMDIGELPTSKERANQSQTQKKNKGRAGDENGGESSTQATAAAAIVASTQHDRSGTSGTYILLYNMREEYRKSNIISLPTKEYKDTGLLYIILGLIFLNQQSMTSPDLYAHLDRLKLTDASVRDTYLNAFVANGYLKKTKKPETAGDDIEYDFTWGARAVIEIPHQNIVNFLSTFYNESEEEKLALTLKMFKQAGYNE